MSRSVTADKTLIWMIERKEAFLQLIDYLDRQEQGQEIPQRVYEEVVLGTINKTGSETERRRLSLAFDLENLLSAGLLIALDNNLGTLVFQPFVIEMFRHFDQTRLRALSSEQLEKLRADLNRANERLCDCHLLPGDRQFEDLLLVIFESLRHTQAQIKQNVMSLQGQAERLSAIVDEQNLLDLAQTQKTQRALEEINRIYQHHVLPTLQFLNEQESLKTGLSALTAVERIAERLNESALPAIGQRVLFAKSGIRAFAKDVEFIRKTLERYVRQNQRQRQQYDAIEALFNQLSDETRLLHDGKLYNKYLNSELDAFHAGRGFSGLKKFSFNARLEWVDRDHRLYFDELLRVKLPKLKERQRVELATLNHADNPRNERDRLLMLKKQRIQALINACDLPDVHEDLHVYLHEYLKIRLEAYVLSDLLEGLSWMRSRIDRPIKTIFTLHKIRYGGLCLEYFPLTLKGVQNDQ